MKRILKESSYNYVMNLPRDGALFFNFFTLNLLSLNSTDTKIAEKILVDPYSSLKGQRAPKIKKILMDNGLLIDKDLEEINILKNQYDHFRKKENRLNLTIVPTTDCNFNCIYCYQKKRHQKMNLKVEKALLNFAFRRIEGGSDLEVTWFGGEPLICIDIIERLSESFIEMCENKKVKYSAQMVTNGYLLGNKVAKKMGDLNVKYVQITLDGPSHIHDKRRPLKGGGMTFDKILRNIEQAVDNINIDIRMNVDNKNKNYILDLLDQLANKGLEKKVGFYIGQTYPYTEACADVSDWCLGEQDISILEVEIGLEMIERGFMSYRNPRSAYYHCIADSENSFVVTPSGILLKCWNDVGKVNEEVGHLLMPVNNNMKENQEKWRRRDPFKLECVECKLLPICMGGCPYLYNISGKVHCHLWKFNLDLNLLFYYYRKKIEKEEEIIRGFWNLVNTIKEKNSLHRNEPS